MTCEGGYTHELRKYPAHYSSRHDLWIKSPARREAVLHSTVRVTLTSPQDKAERQVILAATLDLHVLLQTLDET